GPSADTLCSLPGRRPRLPRLLRICLRRGSGLKGGLPRLMAAHAGCAILSPFIAIRRRHCERSASVCLGRFTSAQRECQKASTHSLRLDSWNTERHEPSRDPLFSRVWSISCECVGNYIQGRSMATVCSQVAPAVRYRARFSRLDKL